MRFILSLAFLVVSCVAIAQPKLLKNFDGPGSPTNGSFPEIFFVDGNSFYFVPFNPAVGQELW